MYMSIFVSVSVHLLYTFSTQDRVATQDRDACDPHAVLERKIPPKSVFAWGTGSLCKSRRGCGIGRPNMPSFHAVTNSE